MDPKPLWKRAAALLAAVGVSIFLAGGISADDEIAEAEPAATLKPTQAIADIPEEYNELFEIQWGGGSLYHLKARLATMGCMLNTIWVYDDNRWFSYNQYDVPQAFNQPFLTKFKVQNSIPATTLYGTCIDICTFDVTVDGFLKAEECKSWEQLIPPIWAQDRAERQAKGRLTIDEDASCNDDFHPLVKDKIFPLLPLMPDTCIVRQPIPLPPDSTVTYGSAHTGYIVLWSGADEQYAENENAKKVHRIQNLHVEIHELCHVQQSYYSIQQAPLNQFIPYELGIYKNDANREFMDIIGMTENPEWSFQLPDDSIYRELYGGNPIENSAELCTLYLLERIEQRSIYHLGNETFNPYRYLTPEIVQWLEKYMVLPHPNVGEEAD